MTTTASIDFEKTADETVTKQRERRALGVACGAHVLHDGYTDLIWVALPIWQTEFGLSYATVGLLRMIYSGTMASLQIPASHIAERIGAGAVLAIGTALCGLCYCLAGIGSGFWALVAALFLGGLGAATEHPIGSALVTRVFTGARALTAFGTYNFASYAKPERRTHALSVFYTITIGSAALSPPLSGAVGDLIGVPSAIGIVSLMTLVNIPLAVALKKATADRCELN